ncbi:MAG TPA: DoxX family protein [Microthrixaceae bacterium]|nr:DoxX family protein [Microthrixaceae bacterium]
MALTRQDRRALGLAAFIGSAGAMHFIRPDFFDAVVPRWMPGRRRTVTHVSGVMELVGAALVVPRRTRRLGGWWCAATFIGVFPANIQMAVDGGMDDVDPPFDSPAVAWARLPMQLPMIWLAVRVARDAS